MKIKLVLLFSIASLCLSGCALLLGVGNGPKGSVKNEVSITSRHSEGKMNAVKLTCISSSYDENFLTIYLWNNTDERIFIEWENARCQSGKVVFGDDRRITMNNAKADEAISANSHSLTKEVTSADNIMSDDIIPLFRTKYLQDGIDKYVKIKIPVRFADGNVEEYDFYVRLYWESETPN